jgi:hypothetical protein
VLEVQAASPSAAIPAAARTATLATQGERHALMTGPPTE